jgi:UDP:flavonoid glycosyltransferase YjiC (YdhE family)
MAEVRFVFETVGTRGDVDPLLAVAGELRRRGFDATLLAPAAFSTDARGHGVDFVPTTEQHLDHAGRVGFDDFYFPAFRPVVDYFDRVRASRQRQVVVNIDKTATSNLLCERDGLEGVRLHLAPFKLRSFVAPPWPYAAGALGPDRSTYLRSTLPRFFATCDSHPALLAHINRRRRALGLGLASSATPPEPHLREQVCLFPDWYCSPPPDWPARLKMLGFPTPTPAGSLPERVSRFLAAGEPPLVFTTGTGVYDVAGFFRHARACCALLGRRGLFLSPHLAAAPSGEPSILQVDYLELSLVLRHCALLVHHGGVGTLARAVEAGIPQIVSPLKYDQFDNARRVEALGLGARLEREELSASSLAAAAARLLCEDGPRQRLHECHQRLLGADSVSDCATLLENMVAPSGLSRGREQGASPLPRF